MKKVNYLPIEQIKIDEKYKNLIPRPSKEDYHKMVEDIKKNGIAINLVLNRKNKLIEGFTRYDIAKELGIKEIPVEWRDFDNEADEKLFIFQSNLLRRHLNTAQKTQIGMEFLNLEREKAKQRQALKRGVGLTEKGRATEIVAKKVGVSEEAMQQAVKIESVKKELGQHPEKQPLLEKLNAVHKNALDGKTSLAKAYELAQQIEGTTKAKKISTKPETDMYRNSIKQWNPFQGCKFDCIYCEKSFKAQAKRRKQSCIECYNYTPHKHPNRLNDSLPKTKYMQFVFTVSSGDVSFCDTPYLQQIINEIKQHPETTFLLQSKNPNTFNRIAEYPKNIILGTTLETDNDELYISHNISKAPTPSKRYKDFLAVNHETKMVTIEPVLKFGNDLLRWVKEINPIMVWLGYETKGLDLPIPTKQEFWKLYKDIGKLYIPVILKRYI